MDHPHFRIAAQGLTLDLIQPTPETYVARLIAQGLAAERPVFHYGGDFLGDFFRDLARDWRGWEGERVWSSLEGTLSLRATIAKTGHVAFAVSISEGPGEWRTSGEIRVENGQLDRLAADAHAFCALLGAAT